MPWDFATELSKHGPQSGDKRLSLTAARSYCAFVTKSHYENFTVVSALLPRRLVPHFHAVYAYCRWADDLADETSGGKEALDLLAWWRRELHGCYDGSPTHPVMIALQATVTKFHIPREPFLNLLIAFEQDQHVKQYDTFEQLLGYCRNSANPVGHLVLYLFECFTPERARLSDEVCTGLQLANFWQDIARDAAKGRCYVPIEDQRRFNISEADWNAKRYTAAFAEVMKFELNRTQGYFERGSVLLTDLPGMARLDVELFIGGGRAILSAIEAIHYDVWSQRPEVSKRQKLVLLIQAVLNWLLPQHQI